MFRLCYKSIFIFFISTTSLIYSQEEKATNLVITDDDFSDLYLQAPTLILKTHNTLRTKLNLPPLKLKKKLNSLSKEWAGKLARERKLYHKPHNEYGENIYMENYQTGLHYPSLFVHSWYSEQKFFRRNLRFNELHLVSNFTQIIWRRTEYLGVAAVTNDASKEVYLVCMYDPPGNIIDEYLNNIDLDTLIPEIEQNLKRPKGKLSLSVRLRSNLRLLLVITILTTSNINLI